jgi:hypothetical protein
MGAPADPATFDLVTFSHDDREPVLRAGRWGVERGEPSWKPPRPRQRGGADRRPAGVESSRVQVLWGRRSSQLWPRSVRSGAAGRGAGKQPGRERAGASHGYRAAGPGVSRGGPAAEDQSALAQHAYHHRGQHTQRL